MPQWMICDFPFSAWGLWPPVFCCYTVLPYVIVRIGREATRWPCKNTYQRTTSTNNSGERRLPRRAKNFRYENWDSSGHRSSPFCSFSQCYEVLHTSFVIVVCFFLYTSDSTSHPRLPTALASAPQWAHITLCK